jgi:short-subunit dehydrogenase
MTDQKTIAIFGAGTGLGASVAKRFGKAGYRVALVARNPEGLNKLMSGLVADGVAAKAFPCDLAAIDSIPSLVSRIEADLGPISVTVFSPVPDFGFIPAATMTAQTFLETSKILTLAPIELVRAVLPGMLERKHGAIIVVDGSTTVHPMAGMSGPGPAAAATRNFILALNQEIGDRGVYAGMLHIAALIDRSAGLRAAALGGFPIDDARFPKVDPDQLADEVWSLMTDKNRAETVVPSFPQ